MRDCIFCKLPETEAERVIYEDGVCRVMLNKWPVERGHLMVVSRRHYSDLLSTPDATIAHMFAVAKRFARRTKKKLGCMGMDIGVNVGGSGSIRHFHIHILPRYSTRVLHFAAARKKTKRNEIRRKEALELIQLLSM